MFFSVRGFFCDFCCDLGDAALGDSVLQFSGCEGWCEERGEKRMGVRRRIQHFCIGRF